MALASPFVIHMLAMIWKNSLSFRLLLLILGMLVLVLDASAQSQSTGTLQGRVLDPVGALVTDASVTLIDSDDTQRTTQTDQTGSFRLSNVAPGSYTVVVRSQGFELFEKSDVAVSAGKPTTMDIRLALTLTEEVTVEDSQVISTAPEANASAMILREEDLRALPDDADDLEAALQALAGPAAGPSGGEVLIDGFSGGSLPPPDTIREIRINSNPFSSEYDRLGFGRIEVFTKPGTDRFRGEVEFEFEDESFNSRNPFATNRPPFQIREFGGNLGGPLIKSRASFFVDFEHEAADNNAVVNALVLDPSLVAVPFQVAFLVPEREIEFSPRVDFKLNENHTLVARYMFERSRTENEGIGGFNLPSRAYRSNGNEHILRLTETGVINASTLNETRFQYIRRRSEQEAADNRPTIRVLDAFTSGGANIGSAFSDQDRFELQNFVSILRGNHSLKFGGRLRHVRLADSSPDNFAGTFTFTSLEQFRGAILDLPGVVPTQFSIAGGNPLTSIRQTDLGLFVQDDWKVTPQLTLSTGLRYETQTNISSNFNFAPRIGFAYAPGGGGSNRPATVIRGGFGIFYDRFSESLSLQAERFNGLNQQRFLVTDASILGQAVFTADGVTNVPTVESLTAFAQPQVTRVVSPDLGAPYTLQTALSVERQLPLRTTVSATYAQALTKRLLRSRNINAPLDGVRPFPDAGNIFQYESTGRFRQHQMIVNIRSNFSERASAFGNYALGTAKSDSDGAGTFPANSYDLSDEWGRSRLDIRHRFVIGGNFDAPLGIGISPFIIFRSGMPFNITTGVDANEDTIFNERPAFAVDPTEPGIIATRFGAFDPTPDFGDLIIPRNYGTGPSFFVTNLRVRKEFSFGGPRSSAEAEGGGFRGGRRRGGLNSPFGGAQRGGSGGDDEEGRFKIEFSVRIRNLFNTTNGAVPVGNLRSALFGQSLSSAGGFGFGGGGFQSAGNRRIEFEIEFSF